MFDQVLNTPLLITVFTVRLRNVLNTSWRLVNKNSLTWWHVLKTFWRHLCKTSWRCLEDVFARSLEEVFKMSGQDILNMSWRPLQNVLETSWRCLEDVFTRRLEDVLKTTWRRMAKTNILILIKTSWRRLMNTKTKDVFIKTNVCWDINIIVLRHFLYLLYLCPCLGLGLFISYLRDLFFIFIFIIIIIKRIISWIQTLCLCFRICTVFWIITWWRMWIIFK